MSLVTLNFKTRTLTLEWIESVEEENGDVVDQPMRQVISIGSINERINRNFIDEIKYYKKHDDITIIR